MADDRDTNDFIQENHPMNLGNDHHINTRMIPTDPCVVDGVLNGDRVRGSSDVCNADCVSNVAEHDLAEDTNTTPLLFNSLNDRNDIARITRESTDSVAGCTGDDSANPPHSDGNKKKDYRQSDQKINVLEPQKDCAEEPLIANNGVCHSVKYPNPRRIDDNTSGHHSSTSEHVLSNTDNILESRFQNGDINDSNHGNDACQPDPRDQGYAWVVVLLSVIVVFIMYSTWAGFGVYLTEFAYQFPESKAYFALLFSIQNVATGITGRFPTKHSANIYIQTYIYINYVTLSTSLCIMCLVYYSFVAHIYHVSQFNFNTLDR